MIEKGPLAAAVKKWIERCNRAYHTRLYTRRQNPDGTNFFDEDWDTLVLLDACRYDYLERVDGLPGRLESRQSLGSMTSEFVRSAIAGRDLTDTIYVTATPQLHRVVDESEIHFHKVVRLWEDLDNFWTAEDGRNCILPETTTEHALQAAATYPNKRLLIHYTQPHLPFIDPATEALERDGNPYKQYVRDEIDVTAADLRQSYENNLRRAIPHVRELLTALDGKTVVTADHGHLLGERSFPIPVRMWGHPHGTYVEELVKVPWLVYESGDRRRIVAEPPVEDDDATDFSVIKERLRDLGYDE
ncbi:hypothetical protein GJ629_01900 [Halapricum sp. CBA1109]|uniref:hypothetical protein n=1 Tax=Halapricum sp. CBA1109 TaxID=2668068 RepID=UPI0012F7786B|nr:hypothetical protein [Halapricum sp. CBA1109]MUV88793.1 hypothetical protein [Halapricum sp. CBA1109]